MSVVPISEICSTSQNGNGNLCRYNIITWCNGCEAIQFAIMNTELFVFGSFTRSRSHVENKLIWMSEMYIWSQKLGRVCYGITLAISCLPTWSSGTMPKCRFCGMFHYKTTCLSSLKTVLFALIKSAFHHISSNANGLSMNNTDVIVLEVTLDKSVC